MSTQRVMASERLAPLLGMVDDRRGILARRVAHRLWIVHVSRRYVRELRDPAPHICTVRIELLALRRRVEDPEVRRGVGATPGHPLPPVLVGGQVEVHEVISEVARSVLPLQVQVLDEEARHDHPHAVVHPSLAEQLAHACVNDREAGATFLPRLEFTAGLVVLHRLEVLVVVPPGRVRASVEHVGVELPEGQLASVRLGARGASEVGQHRAGMDLAPAKVDGHPGRPVGAGFVAHDVVVVEIGCGVVAPTPPGRRLAGLGKGDVVETFGLGKWRRRTARIEPRDVTHGRRRIGPAVLAPRGVERCEHLEA